MKRFIEGEDRTQITLLPECLDDYVAEDNPVRVVEVFVDELDLGGLGFEGIQFVYPAVMSAELRGQLSYRFDTTPNRRPKD